MPLQYNRAIELRVFAPPLVFTIRDLHMEFTVDLNRNSTPNIAKIKIFNLSELTRNLISEDHQGLELYAGYNPLDLPILPPLSLPQIFKGATINVSHYKHKTDWVTEILAGDGNKEFLESYYSKSFKKGTPISLVLADLASQFLLPFSIDFIDPTALLARGQSFSGKVHKILTKICNDYLLTWSFQNQVLEVINANDPPLKDLTVTILAPDTGMIESAILVERPAAQKKKKVNKGKKKKKLKPIRLGVQVRSLLNGDIKPNRLFKIRSALPTSSLGFETLKRKGEIKFPTATSIYIADKVTHKGSNFDVAYESEIEGDIYTV